MTKYGQEDWNALIAAFPNGTTVAGTVTVRAPFGVFVKLDDLPDVVALLEIIHFEVRVEKPEHRIDFPDDYPEVGTRIEARILGWSARPKDVRLTQLQHLEWSHREWIAENRE